MDEIKCILDKYTNIDVKSKMASFSSLIEFSGGFYKDVAEIYDSITRIRNLDRNPTGFSYNDAAILGLLVRIWKILKEIIAYYEKSNADMTSLLDRQLIETAVVAKYLLMKGDRAIEDYRKCSYKDRLAMVADAENNKGFYQAKAGKRLLKSIQVKMAAEGLSTNSFDEQKKNRWRLQGKNFYEIFSEVMPKEMYRFFYSIPSESLHGSWNDSMDFHLRKNDDGTFSPYPFSQQADIRYVTPALRICSEPYALWLKRIEVNDECMDIAFKWIDAVNANLFAAFDEIYNPIDG